jgi:hypothetical protein
VVEVVRRRRRESLTTFLPTAPDLVIFRNPLAHSTRFRYSLADVGFSSGCGAGGDSQSARSSARGAAAKGPDRRSLANRRSRSCRSSGCASSSSAAARRHRPGSGEHHFNRDRKRESRYASVEY